MAEEEEAADGGAVAGEGGGIVVVDPDAPSRNDAEDLEDDLERPVIAMDPVDFDLESSEDVLEASAFIVCWDLGFRSGADLVEEIRRHPGLADRPTLIAMADPTPSKVRWAMALGADGVCTLPWDSEAVREGLERAASRREAA